MEENDVAGETISFVMFKNWVQARVAEPDSEEGQKVIHNGSTHVAEIWEDGEITVTKSGDLYRRRTLHPSVAPKLPEGYELFDTEGSDHKRMVITDDVVRDAVGEATFVFGPDGFQVEMPEDL